MLSQFTVLGISSWDDRSSASVETDTSMSGKPLRGFAGVKPSDSSDGERSRSEAFYTALTTFYILFATIDTAYCILGVKPFIPIQEDL